MIGRPTRLPVCSSARPSWGETPLIVSGPSSGLVPSRRIRRMAAAARAEAGPSPVRANRRVCGVGEDRLDRRRQARLCRRTRRSTSRSRRCCAATPSAAGTVDRGAREAGPDAGGVDRRAGGLDQDPRPVRRRVAVDHVEHLDVERRDRRPLDHRVARALHPGADVAERHDRVAGGGGGGGEEKGRGRGGGEQSGAHVGASVVPRTGMRRHFQWSGRKSDRPRSTYLRSPDRSLPRLRPGRASSRVPRRRMRSPMPGIPDGALHVTNGDAVVPELADAAGIDPAEVLVWREILHDGPVPAGLDPDAARPRPRPPPRRARLDARRAAAARRNRAHRGRDAGDDARARPPGSPLTRRRPR